MEKLYVYAIFHANLSFSSIPNEKYPDVIDHCYWPLLDLIKKGYRIGFEFPASTLRTIYEIDESFVHELAEAWREGKCEVIGSGFNQNIFPLIPYAVNKANVEKGMEEYEALLGKRPSLAFVNEQTYSGGLPRIYKEAGFEGIIMDWDNATEYQGFADEFRYQPVLVEGVDGTVLPLVWNSSLNSYKFQRCIYNRISIGQYVSEVMAHHMVGKKRSLLLYGTDVEIFNYRPITQEIVSGEIAKVGAIFSELSKHDDVELVVPSDVLNYFAPTHVVRIETPESPIPCKNRDDYNVLRWAVSGRDDVWFNTECYKIYRMLTQLAFFEGHENLRPEMEALNLLWSSDLRTKTTNQKHYDGKKNVGEVSRSLSTRYEMVGSHIPIEEDFVLINPHAEAWRGEPYNLNFHFSKGVMQERFDLSLRGERIVSQCDEITRYRDGSIRTISLVCLPYLAPQEAAQGKFVPVQKNVVTGVKVSRHAGNVTVKTPSVDIAVSEVTGGDMRSLVYPEIFGSSLAGYLSPVFYDHVGHSHDYYSMGIQMIDKSKGFINDTKRTTIAVKETEGAATIRTVLTLSLIHI